MRNEEQVLSHEQIEQFKELGWVKVEQAFSRELALACQQFLWSKLEERGIAQTDRSTWMTPMIYIQEAYRSPEFDQCNTLRMASAIEDLIGKDRWTDKGIYGIDEIRSTWGWWPVNFALGAEKDWTVPTEGWHWDGIHFRHYVDSPDQGLLCLCLFSDIAPRGGGTLVLEGSHKLVARFLAEHPEGLESQAAIDALNIRHPYLSELTGQQPGSGEASAADRVQRFMDTWHTDADGIRLRVVETTGSPGDVILCHPFLYHTASQNHNRVPRFMCNRTTPLKERMNLNRGDERGYSPLELSVRQALKGIVHDG
ncbi:phytanoyl-CoA dioxygenase PhyH [Paenibacillus taihuensis]|uniref:Phytanoyl-CoA dioxygenase PhyH n=1 Tax=Paenibacillus taihuensis TaxID=1156355 RepID=A0A3D9SDD6_9BACL|nr:phytanoyl-CoA dioxygenase family protein [Paenibacillus taihuensis]REE87410.1 phytanoyl-CoA dioxygenase PhyH [Paenibacillus taihuensis]